MKPGTQVRVLMGPHWNSTGTIIGPAELAGTWKVELQDGQLVTMASQHLEEHFRL